MKKALSIALKKVAEDKKQKSVANHPILENLRNRKPKTEFKKQAGSKQDAVDELQMMGKE